VHRLSNREKSPAFHLKKLAAISKRRNFVFGYRNTILVVINRITQHIKHQNAICKLYCPIKSEGWGQSRYIKFRNKIETF